MSKKKGRHQEHDLEDIQVVDYLLCALDIVLDHFLKGFFTKRSLYEEHIKGDKHNEDIKSHYWEI